MKKIFILSLLSATIFSLAMVSCTDEEESLTTLGASNTPPSTSQALGTSITPFDAKSFRRDIYLLCNDLTSSNIKVFRHNYDDIKDGFPTLKQIKTLNVDYIWGEHGELITWGDKLFCVYHNFHTYVSGETRNQIVSYEIIPGKDEYTPPTLSESHMGFLPIKTSDNESGAIQFSLAELDGYLYAAILIKSNNKVEVYRTSTTTPTHTPVWESLGYIQKDGGTDGEIFDGNEQFKLISATVFEDLGMVSRLYFCRQKSHSHLEVYCFEDDRIRKYYQTDISSNLTGIGTFDVVQGSIKNSGQDPTKIPIQLICSKGDYIVSQPFYPENGGEWGTLTYLKNHNGNMAATMGITTNDNNSAYYTHLYTFVGNNGLVEKMDLNRYQSNTIQVQSIHKSLLTDWNKDSILRSMCTLIGIIEGPPPTMLTNEGDFEAITSFNYPQLILRSSSIKSCEFAHGFDGGISVYGGYKHSAPEDQKGGSTFSMQLGFNFNYEYENKEDKLVHIDKELIFNTSYESRKYAYLVYLVPNIVTNSLFMSLPMSPEQTRSDLKSVINSNKIWEDAFQYEITHEEANIVYSQIDITSYPFSIEDPNKLSSWVDRIDQEWDNKYQTPLRSVQVVLDGAVAAVQIGGSASITNTHKWDFGFKFSAEMAKKLGIKNSHTISVGGEIHGNYVGSKTTKNELSTDITMKYPMIESKKLSDTSIKEFFSSFMISYDKRSDASVKYYKPLIDLGYMLKDEEPWILQYQAEIIR